ncbi:MAG: hypothetical protein U0169_06675 [Polyangiaceae bacterium]
MARPTRRIRPSFSWLGAALVALASAACSSESGDSAETMESSKDAGTEAAATALKPADMYGKYKLEGFAAVNDEIIKRAAAAPVDKLGDSFTKLTPAGVETLRANLAAFLIKVYGGPDNYKGKSMEAAHAGLKITSAQYDYFVTEVIVPALKAKGVSDADIASGFAPPVTDAAFKASIVGK